MPADSTRLAFVVSHPIQYYVPLYRKLASRTDIEIKVFFTWHDGSAPQHDPGFNQALSWDIPLTEGYEYELIRNHSADPGTHRFFGMRNPALFDQLMAWRPDAVHITGYAYASHLNMIRRLSSRNVPVLFRGDSHLLNERRRGPRWRLKQFFLRRIYKRIAAFLYVGKNNYDYYRAFGVPESRLFYCPHSIEVGRFSDPNESLEKEALQWRKELGIAGCDKVLLYAGKLEPKKQPVELMRVVAAVEIQDLVLVMVGAGELETEVRTIAAEDPRKFRVLPFQNQSRMPLVYRVGDIFTLPSAYDETWGLAVNEANACGRRVLVSDKVGCAPDVVESKADGYIFPAHEWGEFKDKLCLLLKEPSDAAELRLRAKRFDIDVTEHTLCQTLRVILRKKTPSESQGFGIFRSSW
jgi:glycosyltransferase involved in cell wall biosynthesis